jgi:hypothetical protein
VAPRPPDPQPLDVDGVLAVTVGTGAWVLAFVVLLAVRGDLVAQGREWWLWTCLTGAGLGLVGLAYCLRRRSQMRRSVQRAADEEAKTLREPLS